MKKFLNSYVIPFCKMVMPTYISAIVQFPEWIKKPGTVDKRNLPPAII
jgi:hypothetical protein